MAPAEPHTNPVDVVYEVCIISSPRRSRAEEMASIITLKAQEFNRDKPELHCSVGLLTVVHLTPGNKG